MRPRSPRAAYAWESHLSQSDSMIRPPRQRRSQESLERVLQACSELLQERGFDGFTLQEVSQRANVSIGAIYARAPSRDALVRAVFERATIAAEELAASIGHSTSQALTTREQVEAIATDAANQILARDDVLRVFMCQAPLEPWIMERAGIKARTLSEVFTDAILEHRAAIRHEDPALAADIAWRLVYNTTARRITHGRKFESERSVSDEQLAGELARAVADYLL